MRGFALATGVIVLASLARSQEARTWTDIRGNSVEATFSKLEGTSVYLAMKDGRIVPTKLEHLSEADRAYVKELTYKPREVTVVFGVGASGLAEEEEGASPPATMRDTVALRLSAPRGAQKAETTGDTRWKIESVDVLGNRILPRRGAEGETLSTEGRFVFVSYTVENDSQYPLTVQAPVLIDQRDRKFLQVTHGDVSDYIPEGAMQAGVGMVQPGFKRLFCSLYELPPEAEPAAVAVFPSKVSPFAIQRFTVKGKRIEIGSVPVPAEKPTEIAPVAAQTKSASVFMNCVRIGQGGDTSGYWYYDRNKKRSLTYGVELRGMGAEPETVRVKAIFVGAVGGNRDLVVCQKEEDVRIEPGKIARASLQSDEVQEYTYYYYSGSQFRGAKLKGVIVQVWRGDEIIASFASLSQWKRYADMKDVAKQMGELTQMREDRAQ